MPNGFLNISHNFAGESQFIIVEWVKSTAQGTPVVGHVTGTGLGAQNDTDQTEVFYPSPHVNEQLQVINLSEAWHLVRFWRSVDGVSKDVLLLSLAGNARTGALYPIQRFEYVVDRGYDNNAPVVTEGVWADPQQDDVGIRDTRLFEKSYWVEERGTASLLTEEIVDRSDVGGGFDFSADLITNGKVMNTGGVYIVTVINTVIQSGDDSGIVISEEDVLELDSSQAFNPITMGGKLLLVNYAGTVLTLTFASLATLADCRFWLNTHQGNQRNAVLQLNGGDTVMFRKEAVNAIILGEGEEIEILVKDNVMYVMAHETGHSELGQLTWSYKDTMVNGLLADGSLLALADYPRVAELIASLPGGTVVNEVTWQTTFLFPDGQLMAINKGKWMSDGTNFRPPDYRNRYVKAMTTLSGAAGVYEHDTVKAHDHEMRGGFGLGGYDGGGNVFWRIRNLTDPFVADDIMATTGEVDTETKSYQLYPIIKI